MKKIVIAMGGFLSLIIIFLILFTMQGRSIRQTEIDNAVTSGMEKAMSMLMAEDGVKPETDEELIAIFMEALAVQIDSNSALTVNILEADVEKGILSAEGILEFKHPMGTIGAVSCTKTMVLEQYVTSIKDATFVIKYVSEGLMFKTYTLVDGSPYINPGTPIHSEGKIFKGWALEGTDTIINIDTLMVTGNATYTAIFE